MLFNKENIEKKINDLYGSLDNYFNQKTKNEKTIAVLKSYWKHNKLDKIFKKNELELIHYRYFIKHNQFIKNNVIQYVIENDVFSFV